jgi:hypothetical protein
MQPLRHPRTTVLGLLSIASLALGIGLLSLPGAASSGQAKEAKVNHYIGQAKCKNCHSAAETGDQHGQWKNADHSKAFELLASEEAKKTGAEHGVADPQKADACLKCHVTAFGAAPELIKKGFEPADGVQCESCHGPGEQHMKGRMAAAAEAGAGQGYVKVPEGEIISEPKEATCRACHNKEGPTFKRFCFYEFRDKVSHLNPKKPRTQAELDARLVCGCGEACACVDQCLEGTCAIPASALKDKK